MYANPKKTTSLRLDGVSVNIIFTIGDADKQFVRIPLSSVIAANEFGSATALTAAKR